MDSTSNPTNQNTPIYPDPIEEHPKPAPSVVPAKAGTQKVARRSATHTPPPPIHNSTFQIQTTYFPPPEIV